MDEKNIELDTDGIKVSVEVLEQTIIDGTKYYLVVSTNDDEKLITDEVEEERCFILKDISSEEETDATFVEVIDQEELKKAFEIFKKLLIKDDIELID